MEPEYFDGDIVYVQKTDHIETGDIGIFQKGNNIYIKKAGENGLISLNSDYPPLHLIWTGLRFWERCWEKRKKIDGEYKIIK